jgi:hypothetical protein
LIKYDRKQAKALGLPTCYGSPCVKHPEADGLRRVSGACVVCAKEAVQQRRASNPEKYKEQSQISHKKEWERTLANPELHEKKKAIDREYYRKNKAQIRVGILEWNRKNPKKVKAHAKKVRQNNRGTVNFHTAKRRYSKLQRTPAWLTEDDHWMIKEAYELAALRTNLFGFSWHVDHITPLQGKTVSGLHVPLNLQVIPGKDNVAKSNSYEVRP